MSFVVDSSALIAILKNEPDAKGYAIALASEGTKFISAATVYECGIVVGRELGSAALANMRVLLEGARIETVPFEARDADFAVQAYLIYGRGGGHPAHLNFGDCFAYALAKSRNLPLLFKGDDFIHTDIEPALKPVRDA